MEKVSNDPAFKPESGMTFLTLGGQYGLFIQTPVGLMMYYANKAGDRYTTHSNFDSYSNLLTAMSDFHIAKIYRGISAGNLGAGLLPFRDPSDSSLLWERPTAKEVRLNDEFTAVVSKDGMSIVVGCQKFSLEKVKEVVALSDKIRQEQLDELEKGLSG
jgi:hypothetical protein